MNFQVITTDLAALNDYSLNNQSANKVKHSDLIRKEREKLFGTIDKPLKIKQDSEIKPQNRFVHPLQEPIEYVQPLYQLKKLNSKHLGRCPDYTVYGLPKYGRISVYKTCFNKRERHIYEIDSLFQMLLKLFADKYKVSVNEIRYKTKQYHIVRVRNLLLGYLYCHIDMEQNDLYRNIVFKPHSSWREKYRQMKLYLNFTYYAKPFAEIYHETKHLINYDFKDGQHTRVSW